MTPPCANVAGFRVWEFARVAGAWFIQTNACLAPCSVQHQLPSSVRLRPCIACFHVSGLLGSFTTPKGYLQPAFQSAQTWEDLTRVGRQAHGGDPAVDQG